MSSTRRRRRTAKQSPASSPPARCVAGVVRLRRRTATRREHPAESTGAEGVDDGSTLTLWTRAPLEKQANLLVDAYNESATRTRSSSRSSRTTTTSPRSAPRPARTACPTCSPPTSSTCRTGSSRASSRTSRRKIDGLDFKDAINKGHLSAGTLDGKEHVLPFVLDLSMLFWNKELFAEAGLDPEKAPGQPRRSSPRPPRRSRRSNKPDTYGTATGLNCGGCLVFTWFPSVWADGEEVMNDDGTESLLASDTAKEVYSTWKDLWDSGAVLPVVAGRGRPDLDRGLHRGQGRPHVLPGDAALVDAVRRRRRRHPRTRGRRLDVRRRRRHRRLEGLEEGAPRRGTSCNWMMSEEAQVERAGEGQRRRLALRPRRTTSTPTKDPRLVTINEVAGKGDTPVALNFQQAFNAPSSPWLTLVRNAVLGDGDIRRRRQRRDHRGALAVVPPRRPARGRPRRRAGLTGPTERLHR